MRDEGGDERASDGEQRITDGSPMTYGPTAGCTCTGRRRKAQSSRSVSSVPNPKLTRMTAPSSIQGFSSLHHLRSKRVSERMGQ